MKSYNKQKDFLKNKFIRLSVFSFCLSVLFSSVLLWVLFNNDLSFLHKNINIETAIIIKVMLTLTFSFITFMFIGSRIIKHSYKALKDSNKNLVNAIQIPHNNPNPILKFNAEGELIFANIAAYKELDLGRSNFAENPFVNTARKQAEQAAHNNALSVFESEYKEKHFINYATPIKNGKEHAVNVYSIDISEMKFYQKELEKEKESAIEASRVKSEFLANMSHELRTPMNGVISLGELLTKMDLDPIAQEYADTILDSGQTLLTILNDILDISKVESGELILEDNCIDLDALLKHLNTLYGSIANDQDIQLVTTLEENTPNITKCDMGRLLQIIRNLLGNALKFTKYGEVSITISLKENDIGDPYIWFHIKDSGIGISEQKIESIFDKFTQADASVTREYGGTGLGLAITKELVTLMGGEINVTSKEGFGSTFYFSIPYTQPNEDEKPINTHEEERLEKDIRIHEDVSILAVDDTEMNLFCLQRVLNDMGVNIIDTAANGEEAYSMMTTVPYDIVFMDCMMPVMDGYQATEMFRQYEDELGEPFRQIIIAMTANAMVGDKEKSLKAGMDDHISKPIHSEVIKAKIAKWLDNSRYDIIDDEQKVLEGEATSLEEFEESLNATVEENVQHFDEIKDNKSRNTEEIQATLSTKKTVFNYAQLEMFSGGDIETEVDILNMFKEQADIVLDKLSANMTEEDWRNAVHKFKGLSGNIGAQQLFQICKDAEFAEGEDKPEWHLRIQNAYTTLIDLLTEAYGL